MEAGFKETQNELIHDTTQKRGLWSYMRNLDQSIEIPLYIDPNLWI